jgi:serine protease Do
VAFGTVMSPDGDVLTKASELPEGALTCVLTDGRTLPVERRGVDAAWDVALLKIHASGLQTLPLAEGAVVGEWTFSPDNSGTPEAVGIVGVAEMPVRDRGISAKPTSKAYMGVQLEPLGQEILRSLELSHGVAVIVQPDMPAARAGIQTGDVVYEAEGQAVRSPDGLMDLLVGKKPGDKITLRLARDKERLTITVPLVTRPTGLPGRGGIPEMLSGEISRMQGPFDRVLQHDSVLAPHTMGGPLLDTDGRCIGLNIARADRTSTYAIEARDLKEIYARLKSK